MSEGEKIVIMEKKLVIAASNYRQSSPAYSTAAEFRRDGSTSSSSVSSKNSAQNTPARREYGANRRGSSGARGGGSQANRRQQGGGGGGGGKGSSRQGRGRENWDGGEYYKVVDSNNLQQQYSTDNVYYGSEVTKAGLNDEPQHAPELGSVQAWGRKKNSNGNSLLGFYYEGSHQNGFGGGSGGRFRGGYNARGYGGGNNRKYEGGKRTGAGSYGVGHRNRSHGGGGSICYNKERFLQANCQFVVRGGANYAVHGIDPDVLVDWELIEQVRVRTYEVQSCPICLYPPCAAKITRCGHIYCWSCILHYLAQDDKSWSKCPICYEAVHEKDLKSVLAVETREYQAGQQITMRLMKKARGELQVAPRDEWRGWSGQPCSLQERNLQAYSKLISASLEEVREILRDERGVLEQQLREEGEYTLEGSFVKAALKLLEEREIGLDTDSSSMTELHPLIGSGVNESDQSKPVIGHDDNVSPNEKKPASVTTVWKPARKLYRSAFSDDEFEEDEVISGSKSGKGKGQDFGTAQDQADGGSDGGEGAGYELDQEFVGKKASGMNAQHGSTGVGENTGDRKKESGGNVADLKDSATVGFSENSGMAASGVGMKNLGIDLQVDAVVKQRSSGSEDDLEVLSGASNESVHLEGMDRPERSGSSKKLSSDGSVEMNENTAAGAAAYSAARADSAAAGAAAYSAARADSAAAGAGLAVGTEAAAVADEAAREKDSSAFYFYQCDDGQLIYMNPLGKNCMEAQYGSLSQAPAVVTATILELETVSMEEETRRRFRVLGHLPLTCQFMMAELDLRPPIISSDVRRKFAGQMEERARQRQRKEREDRQRTRRIEQEENRKMGIDPTVRVVRSEYKPTKTFVQQAGSYSDPTHMKTGSAFTQVIDSSQYSSSPPISDVSPSTASPDWTVGSLEGGTSGGGSTALSFAQMLKAGHQKPPSSLSRQDWPAVAKATVTDRSRGGASGMIDSDGEGGAAPRYEDSWANGIQEALNSLRDKERRTSESASTCGAAGDVDECADTVIPVTKKKNKSKQIVLFSTVMNRHS